MIKILTALAIIVSCYINVFAQKCGDGKTYASKEQTENDNRFDDYKKITSHPEFKGGKDKLDSLIRSQLKVAPRGKTMVFKLNYTITVTCDGNVKDAKLLGNADYADLTNIIEIISTTSGQWKPAKKSGVEVDCIYFGKMTVVGIKY